jgi:hypothetical protein
MKIALHANGLLVTRRRRCCHAAQAGSPPSAVIFTVMVMAQRAWRGAALPRICRHSCYDGGEGEVLQWTRLLVLPMRIPPARNDVCLGVKRSTSVVCSLPKPRSQPPGR